jgi:hypothetical protein
MKKTLYLLFMFIGLVFTSCEPMEDIHDELDAEFEGSVEGTIDSYTLTEDDYEDFLELDQTYFQTLDNAKNDIPAILNNNFPGLGKNSTVNVNFDVYSPVEPMDYTVNSSDYGLNNLDANYFSNEEEIEDFLSTKFFELEAGSYVNLTFNQKSEEISFELDEDDYDEIGDALGDTYSGPAYNAAKYNSFEIRETSENYWSSNMIVEGLGAAIEGRYGNVEGQLYTVTYETYAGSGNYDSPSLTVVYDGNQYVVVGAKSYELEYNDYGLIEDALGATYPGPTANAAQFGSFDVTEGSDNFWSEAMILEGLNVVLKNHFPDAAEGDEFDVNVKFYEGGTFYEIRSVILENGTYVINTSEPTVYVIERTQVYGFGNGEWKEPYVIPSELYTTEFEQRYSNFDDEEEVDHFIGIHLKSLYPYAQEGNFVPVAYKYYDGSTNMKYSSFYFRDGEFDLVPTVVEMTIQFSHNGMDWEPDNTIRYVLVDEDYQYIATQLADVYPTPSGNLADYGNFYMGGGDRSWDEDMLIVAMTTLLNDIAADAADGQKYLMVFTIYNSGEQTMELRFIKTDGEWVYNG